MKSCEPELRVVLASAPSDRICLPRSHITQCCAPETLAGSRINRPAELNGCMGADSGSANDDALTLVSTMKSPSISLKRNGPSKSAYHPEVSGTRVRNPCSVSVRSIERICEGLPSTWWRNRQAQNVAGSSNSSESSSSASTSADEEGAGQTLVPPVLSPPGTSPSDPAVSSTSVSPAAVSSPSTAPVDPDDRQLVLPESTPSSVPSSTAPEVVAESPTAP